MKVPQELCKVTPLSKVVAVIMALSLPVLGFLIGRYYQMKVTSKSYQEMPVPIIPLKQQTPNSSPDAMSDEPENIGTYEGVPYGVE